MSRTPTDQIIAHVDLLRAVDRLLAQAQIVREKRATLERLLRCEPADDHREAASLCPREVACVR
jgi:hypothetical protein